MQRLRKCPFCHEAVKDGYPYIGYFASIEKWSFGHTCHFEKGLSVVVNVYGESEQEVIDKWNGVQDEIEKSESL